MSYYGHYDYCLAINAEKEALAKGQLIENIDNTTDDQFEIGDILGTEGMTNFCVQVKTGHFGVYVGDGRVVHKFGRPSTDIGLTLCDSLQIFGGNSGKVYKSNFDHRYGPPLPPAEIKKRAIESLLRSDLKFRITDRNCFKFALYCRYGKGKI